jgi:hypothetical protein
VTLLAFQLSPRGAVAHVHSITLAVQLAIPIESHHQDHRTTASSNKLQRCIMIFKTSQVHGGRLDKVRLCDSSNS